MERYTYFDHGKYRLMVDGVEYSNKFVDRLAHYEDLEAQGRLVELPCKAGDTVYVPDRNNKKVLKKKVRQVSVNHHGKWLVFVGCIVVDVEEFGKTVFLSRDEAEAALAKKEAKEHG